MAWFAASLLLGIGLGPGIGSWQSPQVERMAPNGGQRGTEVTVTFTGQRLFEPQGLLLARGGLEVLEVTADKPERCAVRLRIEPDCPLGSHPVRLRTAFGLANLVMFQVGTLVEVAELRQGNEVQGIALGCSIQGNLRAEEVDRYAVEVATGQHVQCEVQALRLGTSAIDLALAVLGPDGAEIASVDDTVIGIKDPMLSFTAAAAGKYVVQVRAAYADDLNAGVYRLHVGTFPGATGCLPCGGQPGEELAVTLLGDIGTSAGATMRVRLPDDGEEWFRFYPEDARGSAQTPLLLRVGGPPNRTPTHDDQGKAWLEFPGSVHGVLGAKDAVERFYWHGKKGVEIEFRAVARSLRSPLDPTLTVRLASGRYLANNDDGGGLDSVLRFTPPDDGDYLIEVRDLLRRGGPDYFFRLECAPRREEASLRMVVGRREDPVLTVARGNRAGAVLQWGGLDPKTQLELLARNLPPGVTATFGPIRNGTNLVPLILTAAGDAELAGSQMGFDLRAAVEPVARSPRYSQYVPLVTVRNDQPLLGGLLRELPVAVTHAAPFALRVDAPRVPIVRGAPLALPVHLVRAEGFTEPIRLRALWNPPGLTAGQAAIEGKAETAALPFSANAGAMLGSFPIAVVGQARARGGIVEVCTAFIELEVVEPRLTAEVGRVRSEQGVACELAVQVKPARPSPGLCVATLLGLPRGVTSEPVRFGPDDRQLTFALQVAADAAPGRHRGFLVQVLVPQGGDLAADATLEHRFGGGEIRIDPPIGKNGEGQAGGVR